MLAQVAVLAFGGWLALNGHLTLGTFLAFSSYMVQLVAPVRMFAVLIAVGQQARAPGPSASSTCSTPTPIVERPDAIELPPVLGEVRFDDVRFGYTKSEPVLDGFSLHGPAGRDGGAGRRERVGQVDRRAAAAPLLRRRRPAR